MGAIDKLNPHQRVLGAEQIGVNLVQLIPAQIVIAVSGGTGKIVFRHPVLLERRQHPLGIGLGNGVNTGKLLSKPLLRLSGQGADPL